MARSDAESVEIECDEDGFYLWITTGLGARYGFRLADPEQMYDHVKATIGPWLRERDEARRNLWPKTLDEVEYAMSDPKHPDYHSVHADIWDAREGK